MLAQIQACFNIWLSYANPVVGVDEALRLDRVSPSGAPKCTTGLLSARDSGLILEKKMERKITIISAKNKTL